MNFAVNLSLVFADLPWPERVAGAAKAGFDAVELWWPFSGPSPSDAEVEDLVRPLRDEGIRLVGLNFDAGDMAAGDRGLVSLPDQAARFRESVAAAVAIAEQAGGCSVFNALYGNRSTRWSPSEQDDLAVENLAHASREVGRVGGKVVLEALNSFESPQYPILSTADALRRLDEVERVTGERVWYLYDCYHMQRMEGNLIATIREHVGRFGHVQIADSPGRGEPGTGEIRYPAVLAALEDTGYDGWVALEYKPSVPAAESFAWMEQLGRQR